MVGQDGAQRWHNISGQILAVYTTVAGAVVIPNSGLSFGLSFSPVIHHVATVRARTADNSDDIRFANGALKEGRSLLDATGLNFTGSLGVYWVVFAVVVGVLEWNALSGSGRPLQKPLATVSGTIHMGLALALVLYVAQSALL